MFRKCSLYPDSYRLRHNRVVVIMLQYTSQFGSAYIDAQRPHAAVDASMAAALHHNLAGTDFLLQQVLIPYPFCLDEPHVVFAGKAADAAEYPGRFRPASGHIVVKDYPHLVRRADQVGHLHCGMADTVVHHNQIRCDTGGTAGWGAQHFLHKG